MSQWLLGVLSLGLLALSACTQSGPLTAPDPPAPFEAKATAPDRVELSWGEAKGATGYVLERKEGDPQGSAPYTALAQPGPAERQFSDSGVSPAHRYTYRLSAANSAGRSPALLKTVATPQAPPGVPATFTAEASAFNQVALAWSEATGAEELILERRAGDGAYAQVAALPPAAGTLADAVAPSTRYTYRLSAVNSAGTRLGPERTVQTPAAPAPPPPLAPPPAPGGFSASLQSPSEVRLSWQAAAEASEYRLERRIGSAAFTPLGTAVGTTYADLALPAGASLTYRLTAVNASGASPTVEASATTPPAAPAGFSAVAASGGVDLSWAAVAGASSYSLERRAAGAAYTVIQVNLTATVYRDTDVLGGTPYDYRLKALNAGGISAGAETSLTTPPDAPTSFGLEALSNSEIEASWNPSAGASGYVLERKTGAPSDAGSYLVLSANLTATLYRDPGLNPDTTYTYRMVAKGPGGNSPAQTRTLKTPPLPAPGAPQVLSVSATPSSVSLSWGPPTTGGPVERYVLERGLGVNPQSFGVVYEDSGTGFTDTGLSPATLYTYRLRARNSGGYGAEVRRSVTTQAVVTRTLRVLFVGNSLTEYPNLPDTTAQFAQAAGEVRGLETDRVIRLGESLSDHWNAGTGPGTARDKIAACTWDLVVLQERSYTPVTDTASFRQAVGNFVNLMNGCTDSSATRKARALLFLNWPNQAYPETSGTAVDTQTFALADSLSLPVAPEGMAWRTSLSRFPEVNLYADEVHPTAAGGYLEAAVMYSSLYGKAPPTLAGGPLSASTKASLGALAWETVSGLASAYRLPPP